MQVVGRQLWSKSGRSLGGSLMMGRLAIVAGLALLASVTDSAQARVTCSDVFVARVQTLGTSARLPESYRLSLQADRSLTVEHVRAQPGQPTLLLMPGAISPVFSESPAFKRLAETGVGVVSFAHSHQPRSLKDATEDGARSVERDTLSIDSLVAETEAVRRHFASNGTSLIPVSLSFSGALTPQLSNVERTVEMVPMTSSDATSATGAAFRSQLMAAAAWNPFFGQQIARQQLSTSYRMYWQPIVDGLIQHQGYPSARRELMLEAYVKQSQAIEGFKWNVSELPRSTQRNFVLAGQENQSLLKHQLQTVLEMIEAGHQPNLILIKGVAHNVPTTRPDVYAQVLQWVATQNDLNGLYVLDPSTGQIAHTPRSAMQEQVRIWERSLSQSDLSANLP